jgi:hypothetical protein
MSAPEILVRMSAEDHARISNAVGETILLAMDAGELVDYIATGLGSGYLDGRDHALAAMLRITARALKSTESAELNSLGDLEIMLRTAARKEEA